MGGIRAQPPPLVSTSPAMSQGAWITPVVPASAAAVWVPGQVRGKQEAGVGGLAPGALARVGQAVVTGQTPRGEEEGRHGSAGPCTPPNTASLAHQGSLAAEWGTLLRALQGTPAPAPPAARCIPFAAGALMPLTEGVLGVARAGAQLSPLSGALSALPSCACPTPQSRPPSSPPSPTTRLSRLSPPANDIHSFCLPSTHPLLGHCTPLRGRGGADPIFGIHGWARGHILSPAPQPQGQTPESATRPNQSQ